MHLVLVRRVTNYYEPHKSRRCPMLDGMPPLEREWVEEQAAILNGNYTQGLDDHLVVGMLLVSEPREITPMTRLDDEFMPVGTDRAQCRRILRAAHFWFPVETPCSGRHPAAKLGAGESQHFLRSISHQMCHDATAPENECGLPAAEILEAWAREGPIAAELGTETFCDQIVNLALDGKLRNLIKTFQTPGAQPWARLAPPALATPAAQPRALATPAAQPRARLTPRALARHRWRPRPRPDNRHRWRTR